MIQLDGAISSDETTEICTAVSQLHSVQRHHGEMTPQMRFMDASERPERIN